MQIPSPDHFNHILPVVIPLLLRSIFHHVYHKVCHWLIHTSGHKFHAFGQLLAKAKWLTDVLLVAALTMFGAATEHEDKPEHKLQPESKAE